jgi:hypothetical protein
VRAATAFGTGVAGHYATEGLGDLRKLAAGPESISGASIPEAKPWAINRAATGFQGMATDPAAAQAELERAMAARTDPTRPPGETIPGFAPKTGELTGDPGLLSATRAMVTKDPTLNFRNQFGTGLEDQNAAINTAIRNIQPTGDPADVAASFKAGRDATAADQDRAVNAALAKAQGAAPGPTGVPTPEAQGAALRTPAAAMRVAAKAKEDGLYAAIDPTGTLTMPAGPISQSAKDIPAQVASTARPISGEEADIFDAARSLPANAPFSDVRALASRVGDQMRTELAVNGRTASYQRLGQLRSSIEGVIDAGAQQTAESERAAVAAGTLAPDQTVASRINNWWKTNYPEAGVTGPTPAPVGAGGPQVAGEPAVTSTDPAAAARLDAARQATTERKSTFDEGPVGAILKPGQAPGSYAMPASAVPGAVFRPGPQGAETAQAYTRAAGTAQPLVDTATESLRQEAMTPDGVIDPQKFAAWQAKHADALRALPDQGKQFADAATASKTYGDAVATRKVALDNYQKGAVGKIIGLDDPDGVTKTIGRMVSAPNGVQQLSELVARAGGDQDSLQGIRKAVADSVVKAASGATEMGVSGENKVNGATYLKYIRDNRPALKAAGFSEDEVQNMEKIGGAIQQSQRTMQATRLPGGSNTAQDILKPMQEAAPKEHESTLTKILGVGEGIRVAHEFVGAATAGVGGLALGIGSLGMKGVNAMRQAGIRDSNTLIHDAMLNPELAQALLSRASKMKDRGSEIPLRRALVKSALYGTLQAGRTAGAGQ